MAVIEIAEETDYIAVEDRITEVIVVADSIYPDGVSTSLIEAEGDLLVGLEAGVAMRLQVPATGSNQALVHDPAVSGKLKFLTVELTLRDIKNKLVNGGFSVAQLGTAFTAATTPANSDDTYLLDQWILLSDGDDIVDVSQVALTGEQNPFYMRSLVVTANKKFGFFQPLLQKNIPQEGKAVSLSFRAQTTGAAIRNVRAAVVSWDSTADTITSDIVSAWGAEGTNPTLATNWTYENAPSDLELTTDWQTFTIEGVDVDTSGVNNVGVFIWVDDTDAAQNDVLDIEWVKLEEGSLASAYSPTDWDDEYDQCLLYYEKSYSYGVYAGAASVNGFLVLDGASAILQISVFFLKAMFRTPSVVVYDYAGNSGKITTSAGDNQGYGALDNLTEKSFKVIAGGAVTRILYHWTATAQL